MSVDQLTQKYLYKFIPEQKFKYIFHEQRLAEEKTKKKETIKRQEELELKKKLEEEAKKKLQQAVRELNPPITEDAVQ